MYLVKETVRILADSTASTGASQYTAHTYNGELVGIRYAPTTHADTVLSTTAILELNRSNDTEHELWYCQLGSTNVFSVYPRHLLRDSTGVVMGVSTDSPMEKFPLVDDRIKIDLHNSTAVELYGDLTFWIAGSIGGGS
jgi:hypothetical protein